MKVKELVEILLAGDQEAQVACFDYFGKPIDVHSCDFWFVEIKPQRENGSYFRIPAVDIGPEPE